MRLQQYKYMTVDQAIALSALGKFTDDVNQLYYNNRCKTVGKTVSKALYDNIANINKSRSGDNDYLHKRFPNGSPVDVYGKYTEAEKNFLRSALENILSNDKPHYENHTQLYECRNPNAAYRNKQSKPTGIDKRFYYNDYHTYIYDKEARDRKIDNLDLWDL